MPLPLLPPCWGGKFNQQIGDFMLNYLKSSAFMRLAFRGAGAAALAFLFVIGNGIANAGLSSEDAGFLGALLGVLVNFVHSRVPNAPEPFEDSSV